jgi:hypothetical protein
MVLNSTPDRYVAGRTVQPTAETLCRLPGGRSLMVFSSSFKAILI